VLIHGIGVSGDYFIPFAAILLGHYDVHVIDMPGYGDTPTPPRPLTPLEQADVAADYMKEIGLSNAVVVGQSMGCQTAAQFARRHPDLCEKILLIGPTVNKWEHRLSLQAFKLFLDGFKEPFGMNLMIIRDYLKMGVVRFFQTTRYMLDDHIEQTLSNVKVPVCIVRGEQDGIATRRWAEYLAAIPRKAEVHHIPTGPHNVQYTNPKELFEACRTFLEK
jgi:pimeloyl-ACP methyl ester carboxylesterase